MSSIAELVAIKERVEEEFLARPGVTGIDVGYKVVGGVQTDEVAIRVHVEKKKASVPKAQRVPASIDGAVTDVLERTYELQVVRTPLTVSVQADTTHYATLQGGISIGPSRAIGGFVYSGTLGAIVTDNVSGQKAALTNFHVACVDDGWHVGDRQVQPSRGDTGASRGTSSGRSSEPSCRRTSTAPCSRSTRAGPRRERSSTSGRSTARSLRRSGWRSASAAAPPV